VTHVITAACLESKDQSCVAVCPVDCIYEVEEMFVIHPVECIDCGACLPECPVEAIFVDKDVPPDLEPYVAINAAITEGSSEVNALLDAHLASRS
jgi:ferredoxin